MTPHITARVALWLLVQLVLGCGPAPMPPPTACPPPVMPDSRVQVTLRWWHEGHHCEVERDLSAREAAAAVGRYSSCLVDEGAGTVIIDCQGSNEAPVGTAECEWPP